MDVPIEGGIVFVLVVAVDIVLLSISGRFATAPREIVRWVGGTFLVIVALWALMLVVLGGLVSLIGAAISDRAGQRRIPVLARVSVAVFGLGLGALLGTSVVIDGPIDFASDAALLWAAVWTWRGRGKPGRLSSGRKLIASGLAIAAATGAVSGILILQHG